MNKVLMFSICLSFLHITAMEIQQYPSEKIEAEQDEEINIPTLFARLNCKIQRTEKNAETIMPLLDRLQVLTCVDHQFLSKSQKKDWKEILNNLSLSISVGRADQLIDDEKNIAHQKFLDDIDEYTYPLNYWKFTLGTFAWAKTKIETKTWDLTWPNTLGLKTNGKEIADKFTPEEIKQKRLFALKKKENKAIIELENTKKVPPCTLHDFGTTTITGLLNIFSKKEITSIDQLKAMCTYLNVLISLDLEWFSKDQRTELIEIQKLLEQDGWDSDRYSKTFYRWKLTALDWAEQNIKNDKYENLSWSKKAFADKKELLTDIPCPSKEELALKRLETIEKKRIETRELLSNYEKRKQLKEAYKEKQTVKEALQLADGCLVM